MKLLRRHLLATDVATPPVRDASVANRLRALLDDRVAAGLTLEAAGSDLGVSPTHLVRAFGAEYGIAQHRYLTGRRLDRARRLHHRDSVAHQLQQAMLTTLPDVAGLTMTARYQPADTREDVGGDWYDAAPVPDPAALDGRCLAISVGDVVGHNLAAATVMGQVRSMLRQAAWDHPGGPPSVTLGAFERAAAGLGLQAVGTALLTHGHPSGFLPAGALAHLVHLLLADATLPAAVAATRATLLTWDDSDEQVTALDAAVELAGQGPTPETIESRLGGGWTGEQALAIAVCAALAATGPPRSSGARTTSPPR